MSRTFAYILVSLLLSAFLVDARLLATGDLRVLSHEESVGVQAVVAQSGSALASAQARFGQGDIVSARALLLRGIGQMRGSERVEGFKLLGVCHFLIGDQTAAREAFESALQLNPRTSLPDKYLLDPAISGFFEAIRTSRGSKGRNSAGARRESSSERQGSAQAAGIQGVPPGASGVLVESNAPRSTVFANGLFVGTAGQFIELSPGRYNLAVSAAGFNTANKAITVQRGQQIRVTVNLEDPVETRRRQLAAQRAARQKALAARALQEKQVREAQARAEAQRRLEARQKLEAELSARRAEEERIRLQAQQQARARILAEKKAAEVTRQRKAELERKKQLDRLAQEERLRARAAAAQSAAGTAQLYGEDLPRGSRTLADEFQADRQRAVPNRAAPIPQPAPGGYAAAPPAQQVYPQQPYPQQPYPQQPYPQQGYAQQPYPQQVVPQAGQARRAPVRAARSPKSGSARDRSSRSGSQSSKSTFLAVLPFGSGQFQNGDTALGVAFGLTQLGLVGYGTYQLLQANQFESKYQDEVTKDPVLAADETYRRESEQYIADTKSYGQLMLLGFGAVWAISAVEALVSINSSSVAYRDVSDGGIRYAANPATSPQNTGQEARWSLRPIARFDQSALGLQIELNY
jgi:hypothetical protein